MMIQKNTPIPVENLTLMQLIAQLQSAHDELRSRLEEHEARGEYVEARMEEMVAQSMYTAAVAGRRLEIIREMYYAFLEYEHASPESRRALQRAREALEEVK